MQKFFNCAFLAGLLVLLVAVPVRLVTDGQYETSAYYENRSLAARPDMNNLKMRTEINYIKTKKAIEYTSEIKTCCSNARSTYNRYN